MKTLEVVLAALMIAWPATTQAQDAVAYVLDVDGPVQYADEKGGDLKSLSAGTMLNANHFVVTGKGGSAGIVYRDNATKKLGPEEELEVGARTVSAVQSNETLWNTKPKAAATRNLGGADEDGGLFGPGALDIKIRIPIDSRVRENAIVLRWAGGVNDATFEVTIQRNSDGDVLFKERTTDRDMAVDLDARKFDRDGRYTWTVRDADDDDDEGVSGMFYLVSKEEEKNVTREAEAVRKAADEKTLGLVAEALHYQQAGFFCDAESSMDEAMRLSKNDASYKRLLEMIYASQRD